MSGTHDPARPGDPVPGALPVDVLAELHAGVLDEATAARLRARAAADPQAWTVLAALDATVADLAALPTLRPARMPDAVVQRLDAALGAEGKRAERHSVDSLGADSLGADSPGADSPGADSPGADSPGADSPRVDSLEADALGDARREAVAVPAAGLPAAGQSPVGTVPAWWRGRSRWISAGVLAVAAAVIGIALSGVELKVPRGGAALGAATVPPAPLALAGSDLGSALSRTLEARDYGALSRPETLRRCLDSNGVAVHDEPLGAREVILDGRRGVILALPAGRIDQVRLLVVGPDCGRSGPSRMADTVVPRH